MQGAVENWSSQRGNDIFKSGLNPLSGFNMKGDVLYWSLACALDWLVWGGELVGMDNLLDEPVVFVSNHAAALGPIAVTSSLPIRVHPWVIGDMMDFAKAPEYLCKDFIEPQLHLSKLFSLSFATLLSKVSVRLLRAVDCVPVWQGEALYKTYQASLDLLVQGRSLLIFPEDSNQPMNELFMMTPFQKGFARLGEMYYVRTKKILRFSPMAVHSSARKIKIGKALSYNPNNDPIKERIRIRSVLESTIHDLYLSIVLESNTAIPLPH
jgi:hypothetical protein